jgi:Fe-S cluster biogenesis protein NfuA
MTTDANGADLRATGERIERLLEASAAAGPVAHERSEELVRLVVALYGAGLERLLDLLFESGVLTDDVLTRLADDDLVASLLLVHDLHPFGLTARIQRALDNVRSQRGGPALDMALIAITEDGVARLRVSGGTGCSTTSATALAAVEDAVRAAAPEVVRVNFESLATAVDATLIPVAALTARLSVQA